MASLLLLSNLLALPLKLVARVIGWLLVVLMAVILYDVIGRRYFATGSIRLQELQWHLHGAIAMLGFGWAYLANVHVRIDVLANTIGRRTRLWLEIAAIVLLLIPFMAALFWYGWDFAQRSYTRGEGSPGGMGLPHRFIIKSVVPAAAVLTILGAVAVLLRVIVALRRPDLLDNPWDPDR